MLEEDSDKVLCQGAKVWDVVSSEINNSMEEEEGTSMCGKEEDRAKESGGGEGIVVEESEGLCNSAKEFSRKRKGVKSKKQKVKVVLHKEGIVEADELLEEVAFNVSKDGGDISDFSRVRETGYSPLEIYFENHSLRGFCGPEALLGLKDGPPSFDQAVLGLNVGHKSFDQAFLIASKQKKAIRRCFMQNVESEEKEKNNLVIWANR